MLSAIPAQVPLLYMAIVTEAVVTPMTIWPCQLPTMGSTGWIEGEGLGVAVGEGLTEGVGVGVAVGVGVGVGVGAGVAVGVAIGDGVADTLEAVGEGVGVAAGKGVATVGFGVTAGT